MPVVCLRIAFTLLLISFPVAYSIAQNTLLISEINRKTSLKSKGTGRFLYSYKQDPSAILRMSGWFDIGAPYSGPKKGYCWLQFAVRNDSPDSTYIDFLPVRADSAVLYLVNDGIPTKHQISGRFVKPKDWLIPELPEICYLQLAPNQTANVLVQLVGDRRLPFSLQNFYIQTREQTLVEAVNGNRTYGARMEFNAFFFGAISAMMLFFLLLSFHIKEKALLFYALYLSGAACYALIVGSLPYSYLARLAGLDYDLAYKLNDPVQYLFLASYVWFCIHLLDIDDRYKLLYRVMRTLAAILVGTGALLLLINLIRYDYNLQKNVYFFARAIILPASVWVLIYIAWKVQNPVKWFFLAGSFFFVSGGALAFLMDTHIGIFTYRSAFITPVIVFKSGMLLENIFFAIALSYKLRQISREKEKAQAAYVKQTELNRQLIATENERLEKMAATRAEEIIEKNALLEQHRQQQLKSDFEKQLSEMEMQVLRSQMNPHFIFNSLNSIRHQILTKNYQSANDYLMRFARLFRQILLNSRKHAIPLSEELNLVLLYIQLEKLRFGSRFDYSLEISPDIDTEEILIPSMLLQPFIENALKHGIEPSDKKPGKVTIRISETDNGYSYEVEDNGIGRQTADNNRKSSQKRSLGLKITSERIALFNVNFRQRIEFHSDDLRNPANEPAGTKVTIYHEI